MLHIQHPHPRPGHQEFLGVDFIDGAAQAEELHPERRAALELHGFTVVEVVDLTTLTISALRDIADTEGVDLPPRATKAQIIDRLSTAAATNSEPETHQITAGDDAAPSAGGEEQ